MVPKPKILIVDDEETVTRALTMLLDDLYDVKSFTTHTCGLESLKWIENNDFDYVILDVLINGVSGIDIANSILKKNRNKRIMLITGCSTDSNEFYRAKEMSNRFDNIKLCTKPFNEDGKKFSTVIKEDINNFISKK